MKSIRSYYPVLLTLLSLLLPHDAAAAETKRASVRAILVAASNQPGESDRRLAPYEATLRRILRFVSYRFIGDDTATVSPAGGAAVSLGHGHRLELTGEQSDDAGLHLKVRWLENDRTLMNTGLVLKPGVPAVLGGPPWGDKGEVCAMILIVN